MPLPIIVPIVLLGGAALAVAMGKKKETAPTPTPPPAGTPVGQMTYEQTVSKAYADGMASNDLDFIGRTATWMQAQGDPRAPEYYQALTTHYQEVYKAKAQQAAYTQATGGPPSSEQLTQVYNTAMSADMKDPAQLQWAAALLQANGRTAQANEVNAKRNSLLITTGQAVATPQGIVQAGTPAPAAPPAPPPQVITAQEPAPAASSVPSATPVLVSTSATGPQPTVGPAPTPVPTPIQTAETQPEMDPNGTIALARELIGVESSSGWKSALQPQVQIWQSKVGLTADGKFGPKSGLQMATEVGVLPLVRYWSATGGTKEKQLADYRTKLIAFAKTLESNNATKAHGLALEQSAIHETGQGYPASPAPLPINDASDLAAKVAAAMQSAASVG